VPLNHANLSDIVVPTILIEGSEGNIQECATWMLCEYFCQTTTPQLIDQCFCINCRRIKQRQHHLVSWICPEKDYTIGEVENIFDKIRFALEDHERFFFVLEKAHTLNAASANRLLKVLEEPPRGYVFILLTNNKNALLKTILSRSYVIELGDASMNSQNKYGHPILEYMLAPSKLDDPIGFEQELKKYKLSETECLDFCFDLLAHLSKEIAQDTSDQSRKDTSIEIVKDHLRTPPGPGSVDFFLKRLFLRMPRQTGERQR
jgi:hypothetical protein